MGLGSGLGLGLSWLTRAAAFPLCGPLEERPHATWEI